MKRNKSTNDIKNRIKIFPCINKIKEETGNGKQGNKFVKNQGNVLKFNNFSVIDFAAFNPPGLDMRLKARSIFDDCSTLLNPKPRGKTYLLSELNKIIDHCEDRFLKTQQIKASLDKTEQEMITLKHEVIKIRSRNENRQAFRMIYKGKEPTYSRANMKDLIQNMKILYKRTIAM